MLKTIVISLLSGLSGTLLVEFFINPRREKLKDQKKSIYKSYEIISYNVVNIRKLNIFFIEMIHSKCSIGKTYLESEYFKLTNNLTDFDRTKLYLICVKSKESLESFERLCTHINGIQKNASQCLKMIKIDNYEKAKEYNQKITDSLKKDGDFDKELNNLFNLFLKYI
ncbi:hypothetical protein IBE20_05090 [Francisella tularensis subsp. novicida]|uniref:Uncharacterized protein n=2 Tax=Francisella tularensis TaxID=263 RepID=A0A6I4RSC7_FRATU|nr:hypothetical protein [Francisella tularensis]ABK89176.1 protein of unknown function [Francisella tularensis subsp. novicida U112]AJI60294.1 hypothetical protein AW25_1775 [Francisella tularensis subsp. novicida U112]EDX19033.1 DC-EC Repeat family protein [Francisella tularensis subsp. novicida FTE]MBK2035169.1 hypothetical protein [Francisella tularensis subsp. novicida]MBK2116239.1 hypothetical protein [Francisella tularensis subsp. novicida]